MKTTFTQLLAEEMYPESGILQNLYKEDLREYDLIDCQKLQAAADKYADLRIEEFEKWKNENFLTSENGNLDYVKRFESKLKLNKIRFKLSELIQIFNAEKELSKYKDIPVDCNEKPKHSIASIITKFLESNGALSSPGGKFSGRDFLNLQKVLSGEADNFVIFDNGGGRAFDIWSYNDSWDSLDAFKDYFLNGEMSGYVFMYKFEGKECIIKDLQT